MSDYDDDYQDDLPEGFGDELDESPADEEAYVITACVSLLGAMPEASRERVLRYLLDRFVRVPPGEVKRSLPAAQKDALADELTRLVEAGVIAGPTPLIVPERPKEGGAK